MPIITCEGLCKTYRVRRRGAGFRNAAKTLLSPAYDSVRALDDVRDRKSTRLNSSH